MPAIIDCSYSIEGEGPPLFLIHGIGASRTAWKLALPILTEHFTAISYDLRGHGMSPIPQSKFDLAELVEDLENLRKKTGFAKAHFAGHSLGGMIGPAYALKYPDHVLSLSLLSTAAFRNEDDIKKVNSVVCDMEEKGIPEVLQTLTNRWFTDKFIKENPNVVEDRLKQVIDTNSDVFLNVFHIYAETEMSPWLHKIKVPCLVLTGEHDGGCSPRLNQLIHNALPQSELVILPEYKHSILLEDGVSVAQNIVRFISNLEK